MGEFNRKKTYRRYIYSPFTLLVLFIALLVLLKAVWGVSAKEKLSSDYLLREQAEYNRVLDRKKELAQSVEFLKTDRGVESEIRSKFRVVKEGESVAVIVGDEPATTTDVATTTPPGFLKRFLSFFGI
jgi:cell division protein FtsB